MEIFGQSYNAGFRTSAGSISLPELSRSLRRIEGSNSSHRSLLQQDVSRSAYNSDNVFESSLIDQDVNPIAESTKPLEGPFSQHDSQIYSSAGTLLSDDRKHSDGFENAHETTALVVAGNGVAVEIKKDGHLLQRIPDGKGYTAETMKDSSFDIHASLSKGESDKPSDTGFAAELPVAFLNNPVYASLQSLMLTENNG